MIINQLKIQQVVLGVLNNRLKQFKIKELIQVKSVKDNLQK